MSGEQKNDISALRDALFDALRDVKTGKLDLDRAKAVNELGKTLVDSARVEVDYLRAAGEGTSGFLAASVEKPALPDGVKGTTVHRLKG